MAANSSDSNDGGAVGVQRSPLESTTEVPSHRGLQTVTGEDKGDSFVTCEINGENTNGVFVAGQEDTLLCVSEDFDAAEAKMVVPETEEQSSLKKQEEVQLQCSTKCRTEILETDALLTEPSLLVNGEFEKAQESEQKKGKKPKRRGGKARRNREILMSYPIEKKEKKGYQYSREVMEALRFDELEEQKKRWVEIYCGLGPTVAEEYDQLVRLDKTQKKDGVPDFDFDPRLQFQKPAKLGEDFVQLIDDHSENLTTSDPSSFVPIGDEMECSAVEGEYSQDDDSDDDYDSIQRPAFVVTGEPDFESGPPQDGLEYLRRVRWESARIPKVTVVKVNKIKEQSPYMPQIPDIARCPQNLLPLKQWEDSFLADFSELRLAFTRLDLDLDLDLQERSSIKLQSLQEEDIMGQMVDIVSLASTDDSRTLETSDAKMFPHSPQNSNLTVEPPILSTILKMDSAAQTSMLKRRIRALENVSSLSYDDGVWLFALCVAVDCPFDADTSAAIRSLLRKCASLRAGKKQVDNEVVILNILVTIAGRYFGQLEFGNE